MFPRTFIVYCGQRSLACFQHSRASFQKCTSSSSPATFDSSERNEILDIMKKFGIKNDSALKKIDKIPLLSRVNPDAWQKVFDVLLKNGCSPSTVVDMVIKHPNILKIPSQNLDMTWTVWVNCLKTTEAGKELLTKYPMLLCLSKQQIVRKFGQLRAVIGSDKFVGQFLHICPQVMLQSMSSIQNVSDYISTKMVVRNAAEYYKSVALGCSLEEVVMRHVFLVKCGKYKTPNLKQSDKLPSGNPTLAMIYDTSEEEFSTKVAGLTLEEFIVFKEVFKTEMKRKGLLSSDDSDEEEDSDID